jgi:predicted SAM-dependent methyltransferase
MIININYACGTVKRKSTDNELWINIDINIAVRPDIVCNVLKLPFKNESVDYILAEHILEHFDSEQIVIAMNEIHRVLKEGGILEVEAPYVFNPDFWIDPTHKRPFSYYSFIPWTETFQKRYPYGYPLFEIIHKQYMKSDCAELLRQKFNLPDDDDLCSRYFPGFARAVRICLKKK